MRIKRKVKIKDNEEKESFTIKNKNNPKPKNKYKIHLTINTLLIILSVVIILIILIIFLRSIIKHKKKYDYLIIGSGLYGATFNYLAKKEGKTTLVIEKRDHIGGNLYCENLEGINVHKYGPHIFHTNDKKIWDFVNSLTNFIPYYNQSIYAYKNNFYKFPFNFWSSFNQLWNIKIPEDEKKEQLISNYNNPNNVDINKIFKKFIEKQLGIKSENFTSFIFGENSTNLNLSNYYFNDSYQGIPENGYNSMIEKLLKDTKIIKGVDYNRFRDKYYDIANTIVYTGKIDEYFDYKYGKLEYRTISWENEVIEKNIFQNAAIVNYLDSNIPFTRIIEYKHIDFTNKEIQEQNRTIVFYEYSEKWDENSEPFLPINDEKNNELYNKYKELADKEKNVIFGGRLAEYKYYEMNDIIEAVFKHWNI